jgi:hypothetical protein
MPNFAPKIPDLSAEELTKAREFLFKNRETLGPGPQQAAQNALGPIEHGKFVEGLFKNNSPMAGLATGLASPIYTGFKLANIGLRNMGYTEKDFPTINKYLNQYGEEQLGQEDWSQPSFGEIGEAFKGTGRGVLDWVSRRYSK